MDLLRRARDLYEKGEMHDALEAAQAACEQRPKDADAWWLLGCVSRYTGMPAASDDAFRRAGQLNRRRRQPFRVDDGTFRRLVEAARAQISGDASRRLEGTEIRIESLPAIAEVRSGTSPDAVSLRSRVPNDVLVLYQVNHENRASDASQLQGLLVRTLSRA
jgi:hypothetical protein